MTWRYFSRLLKAAVLLLAGVFLVLYKFIPPQQKPRLIDVADEPGGNVEKVPTTTAAAEVPLVDLLDPTAIPVKGVKKMIEENNANAKIYNDEKFAKFDPNRDYVVVTQVHDRAHYLKILIDSLRDVTDINRTLLIFSHDVFNDNVNQLVRQIDFCRVIQIFYPYSIQIFPNKFPGRDSRDCAADISKETAKRTSCQNWQTPDKYGHYRVAKITQIKHHWWWKTNYVFEEIPLLRAYNNWILFLEEDYSVSPDVLHTLRYVSSNLNSLCPTCSLVVLGAYVKNNIHKLWNQQSNQLAVHPWYSSRHNLGMAMNRLIWHRFRNCSQLFCTYDDYNWDWTLMHLNLKCLTQPLWVVYPKASRVFHIGDCGVHHKCKSETSALRVKAVVSAAAGHLWPANFAVTERSKRVLKAPKENGGWADPRDHRLCLNNTRW